MSEERKYYVYLYFDHHGIPRYVGKGQGDRWRHHEMKGKCDNPRLRAAIQRGGGALPKVKLRENLTHEESATTEIAFIAAIGRCNKKTGPLFNFTDGGEGTAGRIYSKATRKRISRAHMGKIVFDEFREKRRVYMTGQKHTAETKAKIGAASAARIVSEATRKKMRESRKSSEQAKLLLKKNGERFKSPEYRAMISAVATKRWAARKAAGQNHL